MDADLQLSRPPTLGPFGKNTAECKTTVDDLTLEEFDKKAHAFGGRSALLRNLVCLVAHGESYDVLMAKAADRRMRLTLGEGLELGREIEALRVRGEVRAQ
jgi:hypothetical protein